MALRAASASARGASPPPSSGSKSEKSGRNPGSSSSADLKVAGSSKSGDSLKDRRPKDRDKDKNRSKPASSPGSSTRSAKEHEKFSGGEPPPPKPQGTAAVVPAPQPVPTAAGGFLDSGRKGDELKSGIGLGRPEDLEKNGATKPSTTPLPFITKIVYCLPTVSTLPIIVLLAAFGNSLYELCGADLSLISACIAGARSMDVITDPAMSYITDAFQSRWGRRKPFLGTGCWVYGLSLFLLLKPPYGSSGMVGAWFGMMYILYFLTNTYTTIPYDALAPELTDDSEDRSRLFFISGLFDGAGTLTAVGMPAALEMMIRKTSVNDDICRPDGNEDNVDNLCQLGMTCEDFISDSSKPFVLWDRQSVADISWLGNFNVSNLTAVCDQAANIQNYYADLPDAHSDFCICRRDCASACNLANKRTGFAMVGALFGAYFIITILGVVFFVKERKEQGKDDDEASQKILATQTTHETQQTDASTATTRRASHVPEPITRIDGKKKHPPIVPLLMTTLFNKAFTVLLPAWACDGMVNAIVAALLTYYIRYVIAPEYQNMEDHGRDCAKGVNAMSGSDDYSYMCNTEMVLAGCCGALFMGAAGATPVWLALTYYLGKVKTWLLWSCVMAVTNVFFLFPGKGQIYFCAFVCGLNGLPLGAKFLADAILADIIDYDEFLTGSRREATYTMFKSFLPKIMAIPSIAIPISLLNAIGHVKPKNGMIQEQPDAIPIFIKLVGGGLTCVVSVLAFLLKRRFPLKTAEQVEQVASGIAKHNEGLLAPDPVSGRPFMFTSFDTTELPFVWDLDHFMGSSVIQELQKDWQQGIKDLQMKTTVQLAISVVVCVVCLVLAIIALAVLNLMSKAAWSFVPTLLIVSIGISVVVIVFCTTRFRAARKLETLTRYDFYQNQTKAADEILAELLTRIHKQRKDLEDLQAAQPPVPPLGEDVKALGGAMKAGAKKMSSDMLGTKPQNGKWAAASRNSESDMTPIQVGKSGNSYTRQKDARE